MNDTNNYPSPSPEDRYPYQHEIDALNSHRTKAIIYNVVEVGFVSIGSVFTIDSIVNGEYFNALASGALTALVSKSMLNNLRVTYLTNRQLKDIDNKSNL